MNFSRGALALSWLLWSMALAIAPDVLAAEEASRPNWLERRYQYVVINQDVKDVMREFGRNLSIPVVLDNDVDGQIEGNIQADTAGEFLDRVCDANGLAWYYLNNILHVADITSLTNRILNVSRLQREELSRQLNELRVGKPLSAELHGSHLELSGPASWITSVSRRLDAIEMPQGPRSGPSSVRVIRGSVSENVEHQASNS